MTSQRNVSVPALQSMLYQMSSKLLVLPGVHCEKCERKCMNVSIDVRVRVCTSVSVM